MRRSWLLILMVCLLVACGGGDGSVGKLTDDQVHRQWIEALRGNDRATAQQLLVPEAQPYVDRALGDIQGALTEQTNGALKDINIEVPEAQGAGRLGKSTWIFEHRTACYETTLAQVGDEWRVTNWRSRGCA